MGTLRAVIAGILLATTTTVAYSQVEAAPDISCDQKISHAEAEFNAGHFYAIPAILKDCLEPGALSREQSVRAFLVLCQAYLLIDDPTAAEDSYLKLLNSDPEFVPNEKDHPIDIVYLSKKFTSRPIFTPHFRFGVNTSFFRSIYSSSTEPYGVTTKNPIKVGIQLGGGLDWNIDDNFSLCVEIDFATRGYERLQTSTQSPDASSIIASQTWIDLPLYVKYNFSLNEKIRPFGYMGIALNYLLSASNQFSYTDVKPGGNQQVAEGPSEQVKYQRNLLNRSFLIGGGVRYKIGKDFVYADLRYMAGMTNIAIENQVFYADPSTVDPAQIGDPNHYLSPNVTKYHYVSDLFRLDNLSLTIGFVKPLYDPRKIKKARTKSVSRNIRKQEKAAK